MSLQSATLGRAQCAGIGLVAGQDSRRRMLCRRRVLCDRGRTGFRIESDTKSDTKSDRPAQPIVELGPRPHLGGTFRTARLVFPKTRKLILPGPGQESG